MSTPLSRISSKDRHLDEISYDVTYHYIYFTISVELTQNFHQKWLLSWSLLVYCSRATYIYELFLSTTPNIILANKTALIPLIHCNCIIAKSQEAYSIIETLYNLCTIAVVPFNLNRFVQRFWKYVCEIICNNCY